MAREDDARLYRQMFPDGEAKTVRVGERQVPFWRCRERKGFGSWQALPSSEALKSMKAQMTTTERNTGLGRDEPKANAQTTSPTVEHKAADVVARLRRVRSQGIRAGNLWNPDGPEAADLIERLSAEREGMRAALDEVLDTSGVRPEKGYHAMKYGDAVAKAEAALSPPAAALAPRVEGWQDIATAPVNERIMVWVTGNLLPGARFGSAYRGANGKIIARPEGGNGDWTKETTHWMPLPQSPTPADTDEGAKR